MGYFSNGTEGEIYYDQWCARCVHDQKEDCTIWAMHLLHNYEECNNKDSLLHWLIPRSEDKLSNEQCKMFWPIDGKHFPDEVKLSDADKKFLQGERRP